jgi:hypothetical protein
VDETLRRPEPQVRDVAAALLHLDPPDRRAFIGPLIALIERVVADGEHHPADRRVLPVPARPPTRRSGRLAR